MQDLTSVVVTNETYKDALCAKRRDIAGDVAGAPDLHRIVFDFQNWSRRFGRNACDIAIDEIVEHNVADTKNGLLADEPQHFLKVEHTVAPSAPRPSSGIDRCDRDNRLRISWPCLPAWRNRLESRRGADFRSQLA